VPAEEARAAADRAELVELLRTEGLVGPDPAEDELVVALHALLGRTRSRIALVSPYDVVGEVRQPNLPGTVDEYPNWRLPLPLSLEELVTDPRVRAVVDVVRADRG
jgi:4-alpha-glucanotransferase